MDKLYTKIKGEEVEILPLQVASKKFGVNANTLRTYRIQKKNNVLYVKVHGMYFFLADQKPKITRKERKS